MRAALEEGALEAAVDFYADAQPLLAKHGGGGALRTVKAEADAAARDAGAALKRRLALAERRAGGGDAERAVLLLRRLGEGDASLLDKYLQGRAERLRRVLAEAAAVADAMGAATAAAAGGAPAPAPPPAAGPLADASVREAWGFAPARDGDGGGGGGPEAPPALEPFARVLSERLAASLQETAANVASIFLSGGNSGGGGGAAEDAERRRPLVRVAKEAAGEYFKIVRRATDDAARAACARAACVAAAEAAAAQGGAAALTAAGAPAAFAFLDDWGAGAVAGAAAAVAAFAERLHPHLPELSLPDYAAAAAEQAVRAHAAAAGAALRRRTAAAARLARRCASDAPEAAPDSPSFAARAGDAPLAAAAAGMCDAVHGCAAAMLRGLRAYQPQAAAAGATAVAVPAPLAAALPQVNDAIAADVQALLLGLAASCLAAGRVRDDGALVALRDGGSGGGGSGGAAPPLADADATLFGDGGAAPDSQQQQQQAQAQQAQPPPPKTGLLLVLARFCLFLETTTVPALAEDLALHFPGAAAGADAPPPFLPGDAARRLGAAAQLLLAAFAAAHARALTLAVERGAAAFDWRDAPEPAAPRPYCDLLLGRLARAEAEVASLLDGDRAGGGGGGAAAAATPGGLPPQHRRGASASDRDGGGGGGGPAWAAAAGSAVERGVANLFRARARLGGPLRLARAPLLAAAAAAALKALVECVRLQTLGRGGLRQLQVDLAYLRPRLLHAVAPGGATGGGAIAAGGGGVTGGGGSAGGGGGGGGSAAAAETLAALCDDALAAGVERALEPGALLGAAAVERILLAAAGEEAAHE